MKVKNLLDKEIEDLRTELETLPKGSAEYDAVAKNLAALVDRKIEMVKNKEDLYARLLKIAADVGLGIAGLYLTYWGACVSFEFEKNDSISTSIGRKFMDKLIKR